MRNVQYQFSPGWWVGFGVFALALAVAPIFWGTFHLTLLVVQGMLALSLGLMWGQAGILCFGQSAFYGLGAYAYAVTAMNFQSYEWGSVYAVLVALVVTGMFAAALGAMMFYGRISDVYLGVITLVVTLLFFKFLNAAAGDAYTIGNTRLGGFNGIPGFSPLTIPIGETFFVTGDALYYLCAVLLLLVWLTCKWISHTHWGRTLAGVRENELRVQLLGYDPRALKTGIFALSGVIAGLSGVLFACWAEIVTPGLFSLGQAAETIIWVIAGGLGTWIGPVIGAFALGSLKSALATQTLIDNTLVMGAVLVVVVLLLPSGVIPTLERWLLRATGGRNKKSKSSREKAFNNVRPGRVEHHE
jgi:branched-chain amino acid transport system permease protein